MHRADVAVARCVAVAAVLALVVSTAVPYQSWDELTGLFSQPFVLRRSEALVVGMWGSTLLILQVVFLARLPWLERAWGRELLTRLHRQAGVWSFWLVVLHVILFVGQRTSGGATNQGAALKRLFLTGPWLLPATIGTALIVLVVVTSLIDVRRRLRYETWHLLHLWSYVGMGLALPHQLITDDVRTGWRAVWLWGLYLIALGLVVWFRVGLPIWQSWRADLRVESIAPAGGDAVSVSMSGDRLDRLGAEPGQFFIWRFLGGRGWTRGHPYSVSAAPVGDRLRVTVGGSNDRRLRELKPGDRVVIEGPYGAFTLARRRHERALFFAAGVGITPVLSLLDGGLDGPTTVVHRVSDAADQVLGESLAEVCGRREVNLLVLAGHRQEGRSWLPAGKEPGDVLASILEDPRSTDAFVCGPPAWSRALAADLRAAGVSRRDIHREDFSW